MHRSSTALALVVVALVTVVSLTSSKDVRIGGSSTVYPVSLALSEAFQTMHQDARLDVAFSSTGAGFERFCRGKIDMSGASRPIEDGEVASCAQNDVRFVEIPIAAHTSTPLTRPLLLYVNADRLGSNHTLRAFAAYAVSPDAEPHVAGTGYVAYPREVYRAAADRLATRATGTSFATFEPGDSVLDAVRRVDEE